jgi:hypothetical protein
MHMHPPSFPVFFFAFLFMLSQVLLLDECAHYCQYAIAASGWMLHAYMFPCSFLCRLPLVGALGACGDTADAIAPSCAAASCVCSQTRAAARALSDVSGGSLTAAQEAAVKSLDRQLSQLNINARTYYHRHTTAMHTARPSALESSDSALRLQDSEPRCGCYPSEGDLWGMSDVALRWTLQQASDADAAARAAAALLHRTPNLAFPRCSSPSLLVAAGVAGVATNCPTRAPALDSASSVGVQSRSEVSLNLPYSAWSSDASSFTPGSCVHPPLPLLQRGTAAPFHRTDVLHATHSNALLRTPWFVAVDKGRHGEWRSALPYARRNDLKL